MKRTIHLWIRAFKLMPKDDQNEAGVDLAVEAFFLYDLYYPCPLSAIDSDGKLWQDFKHRYLKRSHKVTIEEENEALNLLQERFIEKVVERQRKRLGVGDSSSLYPYPRSHITAPPSEPALFLPPPPIVSAFFLLHSLPPQTPFPL